MGGAIVVWVDWRGKDADLYAQHVLASGAPDSAWPAQGRALCTAKGDQWGSSCVPDGAGGALAAWQDHRLGDPSERGEIYAQHVTARRVLDPAWPADGRTLYANRIREFSPAMAGDGSGGAIVACEDYLYGERISVQHVLASGPDSTWPAEGLALCKAEGCQLDPAIVADGAGGAIAVWMDDRNSHHHGNLDVYAQHVLRGGRVDPAWPAEGLAVCTAPGMQNAIVIAAGGSGGAFVAWLDSRPGAQGLYVQHLLAEGRLDPEWPAGGRLICRPGGS
jgi:hypothetical protein